MMPRRALRAVFATFVASTAFATEVWNETTNGELSANGNAPTPIVIAEGRNAWSGAVGLTGAAEPDTDIVTFTVPDGLLLTSLLVERYDISPTVGGGSFLAIAEGVSVETGFGSVHLSNALVDSTGEWLDDLAAGARFMAPSANVTGLSAPLPAGDYVVWLGELTTRADYTLVATLATPEPSSCLLLTLCMASTCVSRQSRGG